jgi:hypothetical protein
MTNLLLSLSLLAMGLATTPGGDVWKSKIFVGLVLGILWISVACWRRVHWSAGLAFASTALSSMSVFGFPLNPYRNFDPVAQLSLQNEALESVFYFLVLVFAFSTTRGRHRLALMGGAAWFCLIDSLFVIGQAVAGFPPDHRGAFLGNHSLNACVIAMTYPLSDGKFFQWLVLMFPESWRASARTVLDQLRTWAPIVAVLLSQSSMGIGVLCISFAAAAIAAVRFRYAFFMSALIWALLLVPAYFFWGGPGLFHDSDRFSTWHLMMSWWWGNASHLFGTGQGTYFLLAPYIQTQAHYHEGFWWTWLHSDWLQVLFEQGIVGLVAYGAVFVSAATRALRTRRPWLFAAICSAAATALGNFPARMMLPSTVMVLVASIAFMDGEVQRAR